MGKGTSKIGQGRAAVGSRKKLASFCVVAISMALSIFLARFYRSLYEALADWTKNKGRAARKGARSRFSNLLVEYLKMWRGIGCDGRLLQEVKPCDL